MDRKGLLGLAVLGVALAFLWWLAGDVFKFNVDEGIYLEGGRRVAQGQQPYRDFFALTGPLTFWIEGILARLSGGSLWIMRLPMILETAFLAWAVYWVVSQFADLIFSAGMAMAFLAYEARLPKLCVNHRWDSSALATAAVLLAMEASRRESRGLWAVAGLFAAAAAWATPTVLVVSIPLLLWAWWRNKQSLWAFLGGGTLATVMAVAYLQWNHTLTPLIQAMLWTGANYSGANRVTYGTLIDMPGSEAGIAFPLLWGLYIRLTAILPIAAVAGWCLYQRYSKCRVARAEILPLLGVTVCLALSAWPRWSAEELFYTAALSVALCAGLLYRILPAYSRRVVGLALLATAIASQATRAYAALDLYPFPTRVGEVLGTGEDKELMESLERRVQTGDSLFAFPYLAPLYYLLDAHNPTRYSFLQPGMMSAEDEARTVDELRAAPPHWVIYEYVPPNAYLTLWPGSDPARIPMAAIQTFLEQHYRDVETVDSGWGRFVIKELTSESAAAMRK